jgi:Delta7-sterol 5-desaturase
MPDLANTSIDSLGLKLLLSVFGEQSLRYIIPSLLVIAILSVSPRLAALRLQTRRPTAAEMWRDFGSSLWFALITALVALPIMFAYLSGSTLIYHSIEGHGFGEIVEWAYLPVSFFLLLVVHDTYFYWTHRLLHVKAVFRIAHARHHRHRSPSVWTAFAFYPLESLVQAGIYPVAVYLVPVHKTVFALFVIFTGFYAAVLHCGHDLLLVGGGRLRRWLYSTIDHDAHHRRGRGGYGLYFGWWDTWMGTRDASATLPHHDASVGVLDAELAHPRREAAQHAG